MTDTASEFERSAPAPASDLRLEIELARDIRPVSQGRNLLVAFHFGDADQTDEPPGVVSPGLDPIAGGDVYECWWYDGEVRHTTSGNCQIALCDDFAVTVLQRPDCAAEDFRADTYAAYRELFDVLQTIEHGHVVKIWNYFGGINDGEDDAEKYRQFSIGRAQVFEELGIVDDTVPTGTAIGTVRNGHLSIIALTSRHDFRSAENPRQVSAFRYPRQYGPRSPKFSRGGCIATDDSCVYLISGTAAIVGHQSQHPFDVTRQTAETFENLGRLCEVLSGLETSCGTMRLDSDCVLRVYLRDPNDIDFVAHELQGLLGEVDRNVVFLNAHICRRELMMEIDGVRVIRKLD